MRLKWEPISYLIYRMCLKWEPISYLISKILLVCKLYHMVMENAINISLCIQKQTFHRISVSITLKYNFRKINVHFWNEALHGIAFNMKKKKMSQLLSPCFFQYFVSICGLCSCCSGLEITVCSPAAVILSYLLKFKDVKSKTKLYSEFFFLISNSMICNHNPNFT